MVFSFLRIKRVYDFYPIMNSDTVVLDISSDDEEEGSWGGSGSGSGSRGNCDGDDHNWLTELLDEVDRETDDSDDVVVVSEVVVNPKQRLKTVSLKGLADDVDDDDECMILDGDPDKPVAIRKDDGGGGGGDDDGNDSDELVVVSEKGQVACRDYPHPRHHCARFPFSSSPHENHCNQCHCYVCDSLAPCVHWGAGSSSVDHCHATEKDEFWRLQRKSKRIGDKVSAPALEAADASVAMGLSQFNEIALLSSIQPPDWPNDSDLRPTSLRACSMSSNFPGPNILSQSRSHRHGYSLPTTNRFQRNLVSQQLLSMCNCTNPRDRRSGYLGPQFARDAFKRSLLAGIPFKPNRCSYSSSRVPHDSRCPPSVVMTSNRNPVRLQEFHGGAVSGSDMYMSPSQPLMGNVFDSAPSHDLQHFRSQLPPHPTVDIPSDNLFPSGPEVSPHPNGDPTSVYSVHSESQVSTSPNHSVPSQLQLSSLTNFTVLSEPQVSSQTNYPGPLPPPTYHVPLPPPPTYPVPLPSPTYPVPSQPQVATQPNYMAPSQAPISSVFNNPAPSEPQVNTRSIPVSNYCHSVTEQRIQTQIAEDTDFPDYVFNWISPPRESGQQSSTKNLPAEGVAPLSEVPIVGDPGLGDDFQYDSWIF